MQPLPDQRAGLNNGAVSVARTQRDCEQVAGKRKVPGLVRSQVCRIKGAVDVMRHDALGNVYCVGTAVGEESQRRCFELLRRGGIEVNSFAIRIHQLDGHVSAGIVDQLAAGMAALGWIVRFAVSHAVLGGNRDPDADELGEYIA